MALPCSVGFAADPFPPGALPGVQIGGGLPSGYECSGAAWHTGLDKLFTIHDGGTVSTMNADGTGVQNWSLPGDLEGITVADPGSDFIYVGVEDPDSIREFDITTGSVTRTFDLKKWMKGPSNLGLEALTFVPDAGNPEGGLFYAGLQNDGKIYSFQLPIVSSPSNTKVTHVSTITPVAGRSDISGLHYDVDNRVLYAIFDTANRFRAMESDGTFLAEWELPGGDQEGVTLAGGHLYIAEDLTSGQILDYSPFTPLPDPGTMTWDGTDGADWTSAHWTPGDVTPNPGEPMVVNSGTVIVSTDLTAAPGPAASLDIANDPPGGTVSIASTGKLLVTDDVNLGAGGTLDVSGVLVADEINVTGGLLTNNGVALIGSDRLIVSAGVVSATHPITVAESLAIGAEPVISVGGGHLLGIKGDDLLNNPLRELTLQGGEVTIHSGGSDIDMPGTDLIVVDNTVLDLGAATSATFDELVLATGSILTVESDSEVSLFFRSISGEGTLTGTNLNLSTGFISPGDTGRVLTIMASAPAVADYVLMLEAMGFTSQAGNATIALLDGDSYPVISTVPEPATLGLLVLGSAILTRRRQRGRP